MKTVKGILVLAIAILLFIFLHFKFGSVPPLGNFISPFTGFWQNGEADIREDQEIDLKGLRSAVSVLYDSIGVPHIFARNKKDLYFAQGYITAADRLWQMEFQTMAAAGRVSEIVGPMAIEFDRYQRRIGMVYGAERSLEVMMAHPQSKVALEAYTAGINAYIEQLQAKDYPFEYKLLGYAPEKWTPLKCALLLKQMTKTLNGGSDDYYLSNLLARYGAGVVKDLFPDYPFHESPVIPKGTPWNFKTSGNADSAETAAWQVIPGFHPPRPEAGTGSNNWALSGERTASGQPILANDPHLNLTLPSIWYQVQLTAPGLNVCGVSLPGAPGVISGFNEQIAWGVTNVGSDVLDFYQIRFKDGSKEEYRLDSAWVRVKKRAETIRVRGEKALSDTVIYTRYGPLAYEENEKAFDPIVPAGYAVKWIAHEGGNEVLTFLQLNEARNYNDYVAALEHYAAPAQNFAFASVSGDIALWVNGKFPLKDKHQGKFLLDGSRSANDWQGWIPHARNPHVKNPPRGFVSSANQFSTDRSYPYYLNWEYSPAGRGIRINELLGQMRKATPDSIRVMQSDNYKKLAEWALPALLSALDSAALSPEEQQAFQQLRRWDYHNRAGAIAPSLFEIWWKLTEQAIWEDEFSAKGELPMRYPSEDRTVHLLNEEKDARWFDNVHSPEKENMAGVITSSFRQTLDSLRKIAGPLSEQWNWGHIKGTHIPHLLGQAALGSDTLFTGGAKGTINALNDHNGPSWRMVVELSQPIRAFGVYPGGQSGNPGSPFYDNMITTWKEGRLNRLVFLSSENEKDPGIVSKTLLQ